MQSMHFTLTPAQFELLKTELEARTDVALTLSAPGAGELKSDLVTLSFSYDGSSSLQVDVVAKHGLAIMASAATIEAHVSGLIAQTLAGGTQA